MNTTARKKILVLVDWFYPGYKAGGPIQSCRNFIAAMQDAFDISVVTSDRDLGDSQPYSDIKVDQWNNYTPNTKVFYASNLSVNQLLLLQKEILPDYIYLNSMFSLRYTLYVLWLSLRNKIKSKIVLAPRGMLQQGALKFSAKKKKLFLTILKKSGVQKRISFHATDKQEVIDITKHFPDALRVVLATNFPRMFQMPFLPVQKNGGELKCIFVSRLSPKKNIYYLLQALQKLPATFSIELEVIGEVEDKLYWKKCLELIQELPQSIVINIRGPIENDAIPALLQRQHLFVLPTLGENFGHAIFDAFLAGRPVLISDKTPWRQLAEKKIGWDIALENQNEFVEILARAALMQSEEWNEWCKNAWQFANDFVQETNIRQQYLNLFN